MYGDLLHWVGLGLDLPKFLDFYWHHCTRRESLYTYQTRKVTKQTQGRLINLRFFNRNVLDMPVPAGIFAINKSIAKVHKLLDMNADHMRLQEIRMQSIRL